MNKKVAVSVIIPTYNSMKFIDRSIQSVLNQTYKDYEFIIVDDASKDGTTDFIEKKYPWVNLIKLKNNVGCADSRNYGIKIAKGKYIAFLDHDDEWLPEYLNLQINFLERNPDAVLSYCGLNLIKSEVHKITRLNFKPLIKEDTISSLLLLNFICTMSTTVIQKKILQRVGPLNNKFKIVNDLEIYLRIAQLGQIINLRKYLVNYYVHQTNLGSNSDILKKEHLKLIDDFLNEKKNKRYKKLRRQARFNIIQTRIQNEFSKNCPNRLVILKNSFDAFRIYPLNLIKILLNIIRMYTHRMLGQIGIILKKYFPKLYSIIKLLKREFNF